jgi:hypothetical protein
MRFFDSPEDSNGGTGKILIADLATTSRRKYHCGRLDKALASPEADEL